MRPPSHPVDQPSPGGGVARVSAAVSRPADDDEAPDGCGRDPKRRKITPTASVDPCMETLRDEIGKRFGVAKGESLRETLNNMCDAIDRNNENALLLAMQMLTYTLCTIDGTVSIIQRIPSADVAPASSTAFCCSHCDETRFLDPLPLYAARDADTIACVFRLFETLAVHAVPATGPLAVRALYILRRMARHSIPAAVLDYETSALCRWCAGQLRSPDRAVRIQATKTLAAFGRARNDALTATTARNRAHFEGLLDALAAGGNDGDDDDAGRAQETSALLWGQLGRAVAEDQLEPMLRGLLRLLDSAHKPVRDGALAELRGLAHAFGRTAHELFEPYWRTTAHAIVRHIAHRPAYAAAGLADLLGTTPAKLALWLQAEAIPELLRQGDRAALATLAELRGDGGELWPTLVDKDNLTAMLAFWVQLPAAADASASASSSSSASSSLDELMRTLQTLSPRMGPATIRDVMGASATPALAELLIRLTYDVGRIPDEFARVSDGLGFRPILTIARLLHGPADDAAGDGAAGDRTAADEALVTGFLSEHVLGLTTLLSKIHTNDGRDKHPCHWIRGMEALEILIKYLRAAIRTARPQVTSFLLDALCNEDAGRAACWQAGMRRAAIACWAALVRNIGDDHMGMLLETTFAVIRRNWAQFGAAEQATCRALLVWLLGNDGPPRESLLAKMDVLPPLRVPALADVDARLDALRRPLGMMQTLDLFAQRIGHESVDVVRVALADARAFLQANQAQLQQQAPWSPVGEKSTSAVAHFVRALFACSAKHGGGGHTNSSSSVGVASVAASGSASAAVAGDCLACLGLVGCLDVNRLGAGGAADKAAPFVVVWNFRSREEGLDFVLYMLEHVLTRAFLSATNPTSQGLIAYTVQTLLARCGISAAVRAGRGEATTSTTASTTSMTTTTTTTTTTDAPPDADVYAKWTALPELVQAVLSPLLVSKYHITAPGPVQTRYPLFGAGRTYGEWVKQLVADLLTKAQNPFGEILHGALYRATRGRDLSVAEFLLPYMVVHVVAGPRSTAAERALVTGELQRVAQYQPPEGAAAAEREQAQLFYDAVFRVVEYAMVWLRTCVHYEQPQGMAQVEAFVAAFPAELLAQKALYCKDYARAVFYLEPVAMGTAAAPGSEAGTEGAEEAAAAEARRAAAESAMIDLYAQLDDPDCLSGIMAKVGGVVETTTYHKALLEQKAGRWESATTWHLSELSAVADGGSGSNSNSTKTSEVQARVLACLLAAGHHEALLARVDGLGLTPAPAGGGGGPLGRVLPLALEAAWATFQWPRLAALAALHVGEPADVFAVGLAQALQQLRQRQAAAFAATLDAVAARVAASMSYATAASLQACHDAMLKAHVVTDLRLIGSALDGEDPPSVLATLVHRLNVVEDVGDKRYVLALQRAAMEALRPLYGDGQLSALWLLSARLARKTGANGECLHAIAQARRLGDPAAEVENARRQWAWGGKHQAIADLRLAIRRGLGGTRGVVTTTTTTTVVDVDESATATDTAAPATGTEGTATASATATTTTTTGTTTAPLEARASLLLTRWLDASGETSRSALRDEYRALASRYGEWEKSHYFLGRHYKKVLEAEAGLDADEQSDMYVSGELARLEIEAYLRAARLGTKYLHTTLPRVLTLWLGLGMELEAPGASAKKASPELRQRREAVLHTLHRRLLRHVQRLPAFAFYTALPQLVARINHPHRETCMMLDKIIAKVVAAYPQQALWGVFGVMTARGPKSGNQSLRAASRLLKALAAEPAPSSSGASGLPSVPSLTRRGVRLAEELVKVGRKGNYRAHNSSKTVSLRRDMHFQLGSEPFPFVVPIGRCLTAVLPGATTDAAAFAAHNAFAADVITIAGFADEVVILGSLAQPRRLTVRGSDGRAYDVLLKPKDDLRTDQRIMEVNALINAALRKDAEAQRRQLAIRTYAVTPLNEDCGLIEWVPGLKTLREIVRPYYDLRRSQVVPRPPDPLEIQRLLAEAGAGGPGAGSTTGAAAARRAKVFAGPQVLGQFPPVLPAWFMRRWPFPAAWLAARQRFTRTAAVMSMAGAVLGLGDRHCENVLVDAGGAGGVMHVDFNCLFEKGRLFAQPETVPFRLTQNMRAAMGLCDHRGPFQRACELTLRLLREQEETLLAVLEAFVHDPTLDLQVDPRRAEGGKKGSVPAVRLDPPSVLRGIQRRIHGLLLEETIPLGVEGQATELIRQATDPVNLSAMYIGWAPHW